MVTLRGTILLTHAQKPLGSWISSLEQEYHFAWVPFVSFLFRSQLETLEHYQNIIVSSPTSIAWLAHHYSDRTLQAKRFYFVGTNSQKYFEDCFPGLHAQVYSSSQLSMSHLLKEFFPYRHNQSLADLNKALWLGSQWGLLKHYNTLSALPSIDPYITHWNWPRQKFTQGQKKIILHSSKVVLSSLCATLSLRSFEQINGCNKEVILSSRRLERYLQRPGNSVGPWQRTISLSSL